MGPGWQEKGKVGYPQYSNTELKIVFRRLPRIFRVRKKISTSIKLLENCSQEASKSQKVFFEGDSKNIANQVRFPAEFWPDLPKGWHVVHLSFCHAQGDKQQQAGLKGDFLHSAAKPSLAAASQLPARSDL